MTQILILVSVPARKVLTMATGKMVVQSPTRRPLQYSEWL